MKKTVALMLLMAFVLVNVAFAAPATKPGEKTTKTKVVKVEKKVKVEKTTKEKVKGKKTEAPKGVEKAKEKGKGEKKGLLQRWFGGEKKPAEPEKGKTTEPEKGMK